MHVEIFVVVITSAMEVGNTRPSANTPESVARIHEVCFYSLTSSTWDDFANSESTWNHSDTDIMSLRGDYAPGPGAAVLEHPCLPLTKILSSGSFYFALEPQWDLSTRFSERLPSPGSTERGRAHDIADFDERFIWNEYIVRGLLDFRDRLDPQERGDLDRCQFIVVIFPHPSRDVFIFVSLGLGNPRIRRNFHHGALGTSHQWYTYPRHPFADISPGLEAGRHTFQYPWYR